MFKKQIGCQPLLFFVIGLFIFLYFIAAAIYNFAGAYSYLSENQESLSRILTTPRLLFAAFALMSIFLIFSLFGIFIMDAFPPIKVDETGITVKSVIFIDHFDWDEIRTVYDARRVMKGAKAVILSPRGNFFRNFIRYYPYYLHGVMAGIQIEPVIILSPGLQDREEVLSFIGQQIRNQIALEVAQQNQKM